MKTHTRGLGSKMAGGNPDPARGRDPDEFYPTPPAVTRALYNAYTPHLEGAVVWEPCAGDGAMASTLLACGAKAVLCSDVKPRPTAAHKIVALDVLKATRLPAVHAVVTNPPFDVAADIIHHILTLPGGPPQLLALVLKASYWHSARRAALYRKFPPTTIHPLRWRPDFKNLGAPTMEIMWCVWDAQNAGMTTTYEPMDRPEECP